MALSRKFLTALGIDAEKIDEIINAHTETVDGLKATIAEYKADAEKLPGVQKELNDLKEANGKDPYKVKYDAIKEDFENYKKDIAAKETKATKSNAYRALLKEAGISEKRIDAVLKVSDVDSIELDEKGAIKDSASLKKSIVDEWADFIEKSDVKGANVANPPTGNGGGTKKTKEEIYAIKDPAERQQAILDNRELFGI